jgi:PAS domain S-box-containing protein
MSNETDTIRQYLLEYPQGLTQSDLSRDLKINRVSLAKYLATMVAYGELECRSVGKAKLYTLTKRLPLESILWHTEDHVIITENTGKVTQIDERTASFFGCSVEQMIGKPIGAKSSNRFFMIDGSPLSDRLMTEAGSLEFIMYSGNHITYFNKKTIPVVLTDGSSGNATILTDITERKQAEKELWESEQKISSILNDITDVVWSISWPDMNVHYISPAAEQVYGRPVEEFTNNPSLWADIVHPDDKQIFDKAMEQLKKEGSAVRECRIIRPDGSIVWIHDKSKIIFDEKGTPFRVDGITSDITESKQADMALHESEAFNRGLVENLPEYIIVYESVGKILYVNPATIKAMGYTEEEFIGTSIFSYIAPESRDETTTTMTGRWETGNSTGYEMDILTKDGLRRSVIVKGTPIQYHNSPAILLLLNDITERKLSENALRQVNAQLNLLSSITRHDILNQLLALKGYIKLSREVITKPEKLVEYIKKEQEAADTIEQQITFTRDYKDLGASVPAWQNVNSCIRKAMVALPMRTVNIVLDPADPCVYADPLFQKVFYNLIDNALRYGGNQLKTIRIFSNASDKGLTIVCEDNGMGIVEKDKKRLFTRGFGKNTGLGLFLSREILAITGITITENGIPGNGARFEIMVPKGAYRFTGAERK